MADEQDRFEMDIVIRLRSRATAYGGRPNTAADLADAADEIERLRRWKAEATAALEGWDAVWRAAGCPGPLGGIQSDNVVAWIDDLRDLAKGNVR